MKNTHYQFYESGITRMLDFHTDTVDAAMSSFGAFAEGVKKIHAERVRYLKSLMEDGVENVSAAGSSDKPDEVFRINGDYMGRAVEKSFDRATKMADIVAETTRETVNPLAAHYSRCLEKMQSFRP